MKSKGILCLIVLFLIHTVSGFAQNFQYGKQEFVYKTVKGHDIKATIFMPASNEKHPVLVYFHGGGFIFGNRDQGLDNLLKEKLLANNYAVITADYRLAPETKLNEILSDVSDVMKWIRLNGHEKFNLDTSRIAAAGGSSGGYLAVSTGFNYDSRPVAIIAISAPTGFSTANIQMGDLSILNQPGPYDIVKDSVVSYGDYDSRMTLWRFLARNGLALYEIFGFDPAKEPQKLEKYTLTHNIRSDFPPTMIVHATNDRLVDITQAQAFYDFLQNRKVESELHLFENGHNTELINQYPEAVDQIIIFLNKYLKN